MALGAELMLAIPRQEFGNLIVISVPSLTCLIGLVKSRLWTSVS